MEQKDSIILSIRRKSDGVIFSIGEYVGSNNNTHEIKGFVEKNNRTAAILRGEESQNGIETIIQYIGDIQKK